MSFFIFLCFFLELDTHQSVKSGEFSGSKFSKNHILIRPGSGYSDSEIISSIESRGDRIIGSGSLVDYYIIEIKNSENIEDIMSEYEKLPSVYYSDRITTGKIFWTPDDPYFDYQWHLDSLHLDMESVWDTEKGDSSVVIAVVDCGVAYEYYPVPTYEIRDKRISTDGYYHKSPDLNGTAFVDGYDFVNDDAHPNDNHGHGTHIAGIISQVTNNGNAVAGIAPGCAIMPVKVLNHNGEGYSNIIAEGIVYAVENGADILNLSLGGVPGDSTGWRIVHEAINVAEDSGLIVVASAGNSSDGELSYPAGFKECIAVNALDYNNTLSYYSQYGRGLDLSAYGGDLSVDENNDDYEDGILQETFRRSNDSVWIDEFYLYFLHGTSMAAPVVSAVTGLMKSHGYSEAGIIKDILYSTADDIGKPGYDTVYGWGLVNPGRALNFSDTVPPDFNVMILPNSYMEKWIDVWVLSSDFLENGDEPPDSVVVTVGSKSDNINLKKLPSIGMAYHAEYHLPSIDNINISVSGVDVGRNRGRETRNFSMVKTQSTGVDIYSPDKAFRVMLPGYAVNDEGYIITGKVDSGVMSWMGIEDNNSPGETYFFLTAGVINSDEYLISVKYEDCTENIEGKLKIAEWKNSSWEELPSYVQTDEDVVYAESSSPGFYCLVISDSPTETLTSVNSLSTWQFSPATGILEIVYQIGKPGSLKMDIYDISGRRIESLVDGYLSPGIYREIWDASNESGNNISSGIYFIKASGAINDSKKIIIFR